MDKNYEVKTIKGELVADYQIKAVFLGDSGVGKTSIIKYEIENKFPQRTQPTSIFQYFSKKCQIFIVLLYVYFLFLHLMIKNLFII